MLFVQERLPPRGCLYFFCLGLANMKTLENLNVFLVILAIPVFQVSIRS